MKKIFKLLLIILVISLLAFGGYKLYWYIRIKTAKIEVTLKDNLVVNFNDKVKVSEFIISMNGKLNEDYIVDTTKVGKKTLQIKFKNDDGIPVKYKFEIEVVDRVEPVIWLGSSYRLKKGNKFDISNILCGDNYDSKPKCYVEGDYDENEVGSYPLTFMAEDSSGNLATQEFVLNVYEPKKTDNDNKSKEKGEVKKNYTYYDKVYDEYKTKTNKIGIDVSRWQGDIDFDKLKEANVEFIIIRVGYTKGTDGEYILDEKFKQNIEKANEYNIPVGLYFYSYANSEEHAIKDAEWVLEQIKDYKVELPIAFDWEEWSSFNEYNLSFFELSNIGEAFLDRLSKEGYEGMLYSSKAYLDYIWFPTEYDIWLAHYTDKTTYKGKYKIWQICDNGSVDGIKGEVDIDILYE